MNAVIDGREVELVEVEVITHHTGYYETTVMLETVEGEYQEFDPWGQTIYMVKK